jgi:threonine dehydrogenase-like Zn-dependent dehydrogenase
MGAGPIGLGAVAVLKYFGVEDIAVCDRSESRLEKAKELGAKTTCNVETDDLKKVLFEAHGKAELMGESVPATDVYIEATGLGPVLELAIALSKKGAHVVVVGVHKKPIQLHPADVLIKELKISGSMAYPNEFPDVIKMLQKGNTNIETLISHRFELTDFMKALEIAKDIGQSVKVMITI